MILVEEKNDNCLDDQR